MILSSFFTTVGVPTNGLSPTIDIWQVTGTTSTPVVTAAPMLPVGDGFYQYNFSTYDDTKDYVFTSNAGVTTVDSQYQFGATPPGTVNTSTLTNIANTVWDELATLHTTSGSFGEIVQQIKADTSAIYISVAGVNAIVQALLQMETGRTRIDTNANTLTVYDTTCTTPMIVFNLRDSFGNPSVTDVCERSPAYVSPTLAADGAHTCP